MRRPLPDRGSRGAAAGALGAVLIWGLIPVGTRFFVQRLDPFTFNFIRFAASCAACLPLFLRARPWRWPRADQRLLLLCALLAVPGYNMPVAWAAQTLPAAEIGLLIATEPVLIVAFTVMLKRTRVSTHLVVGCVVALAGVALVTGLFTSALSFPWRASLAVVAGAASWSLYTAISGGLNERHGAFGVTGSMVVIGALGLAGISWPMMPASPWPDLPTGLSLAAMGLASSTVGFFLWNHAGARMPAEKVGLFLYLIPIVALAGGTWLLGEPLTASLLAGGTLTIAGVWIASRTGVRAAPAD
jgi:drug/metabolite transporter (DMT)-like permease